MSQVQVAGRVDGNTLHVDWHDVRSAGSCRFDRVPGTHPEWLGDADELLEGATRRQEPAVLAAVTAWAEDEGLELGIWTDGQGIELLA